MIVVGVLFLILFPVSLIGYGAVLTWNYPVMKKRGLLTSYLAGFFVLLAIFTIFSISFTILDRPFHELRNVLAVLCVCGWLLAVYVIYHDKPYRWLAGRSPKTGPSGSSPGATLKSSPGISLKSLLKTYWWIVLPLAVIIFQIARSVVRMPVVYSDDTFYLTRIGDMLYTDKILGCDTVTGMVSDAVRMSNPKFVLSSWLQFLGSMCSLTGIHQLILIKSIIPVFVISFHYLLIWRLTFYLSSDFRKRVLMLLFYALLMEFGSISLRTDYSYYLFTWSWYGKALCQFAAIPSVLAFFLMIREHLARWRDGLFLMILCMAAAGFSSTALMLMPVELSVLIILDCVSKKTLRELWISIPALAPIGICAALYFLLF